MLIQDSPFAKLNAVGALQFGGLLFIPAITLQQISNCTDNVFVPTGDIVLFTCVLMKCLIVVVRSDDPT